MSSRRNSHGSDSDVATAQTSKSRANGSSKRCRRSESTSSKNNNHSKKKHAKSVHEKEDVLHQPTAESTSDFSSSKAKANPNQIKSRYGGIPIFGSASSSLGASKINPPTSEVPYRSPIKCDGAGSLQQQTELAAVQTLQGFSSRHALIDAGLSANLFSQQEVSNHSSHSMELNMVLLSDFYPRFPSSNDALHPNVATTLASTSAFMQYLLLKSCPAGILADWPQLRVQQQSLILPFHFPQSIAAMPSVFTSPRLCLPPPPYQSPPERNQTRQIVERLSATTSVQDLIRVLEDAKQGRPIMGGTDQLLGNLCRSTLMSVPGIVSPVHQSYVDEVERCNDRSSKLDLQQANGLSLACAEDQGMLNEHLAFLRQNIEYFRATVDDIMSHTRGRNKGIALRQVGIRCCHCSRIPAGQRRKGSTYFPSTLMGVYQAAQNINVEHFQSGLCPEMPEDVKRRFVRDGTAKPASSSAGKGYWAESARMMGLIDTDNGIRFAADSANFRWMPSGL